MAKKKLVVVESPSKAKTINKYLGKDYIVEASVGHIKDLVKFGLGVDINKDFEPKYQVIRGKSEIVKRLKTQAENAEEVLIATDPDREGEAIAWHIAQEVKPKNSNIKRLIFNEITKNGINNGLKSLRDIDNNLFQAQQARRVLDRLIGFQVSPFVSKAMLDKTSEALSAGRVQSVALRLICERESEIQAFVPIEYWSVLGTFLTEKNSVINAKLVSFDGNSIKNPEGSASATNDAAQKQIDKKLAALNFIKNESQAKDLIERIQKEKYSIESIQKKQIKRNPLAPFTTSSLQQEAAKRLGFPNKKTMSLAQTLYEGVNIGDEGSVGLITYMRTDSVRISPDAQSSAREFIQTTYGKEYLPAKAPVYSSKSSNVQDAHEAVRPTSVEYTPKEMKKYLDKDAAKLYELIYNRFLASQMAPALLDQTTVNISSNNFVFRATGSIVKFQGFLIVYADLKEDVQAEKDENGILPADIKEKAPMDLDEVKYQKHQTKPKPRFNEASIVKELDELGIGRPSTYATIISTLIDRKYVYLESKAFFPTELGIGVVEVLIKYFPELFNVDFTAEMETKLDTIAEGNSSYLKVVKDFYGPFKESLDKAEGKNDIPEIICDKCGAPMVIKVSKRGRFLGCSRYPDCTNTKPLPKNGLEEKKEPEIAEGITCDICGKPMVIRDSKYGKFYGCIDYPKCKGIKQISSNVKCPKCKEGHLNERYSPKSKKKFWGCSNYPKCDYLTNYEPINKECPNCHHYYIEARFRKKGGEWEKYLKCPNCNTEFEV